MIDLPAAEAELVTAPRRRPRRRWWLLGAAMIVVLATGATTAVLVSFRYLHATPLSTNGGGWLPPDGVRTRSVDAGPYSAAVIPPRYGRAQTFELGLNNFSEVTQTVLGLTDAKTFADHELTGEPETLQISTTDTFRHRGAPRFTSKPVTIPPGGQYTLRFTTLTGDRALWRCGRSEYYQGLDLRVRVGMFTRTEHLNFGQLIMEIQAPACP